MRPLITATVAGLLFFASTSAYAACPSRPDEASLTTHDCYLNRDGQEVHRPAAKNDSTPAVGATAQCRDGTWSFSQHRTGTCSHHGGIARWGRSLGGSP